MASDSIPGKDSLEMLLWFVEEGDSSVGHFVLKQEFSFGGSQRFTPVKRKNDNSKKNQT